MPEHKHDKKFHWPMLLPPIESGIRPGSARLSLSPLGTFYNGYIIDALLDWVFVCRALTWHLQIFCQSCFYFFENYFILLRSFLFFLGSFSNNFLC